MSRLARVEATLETTFRLPCLLPTERHVHVAAQSLGKRKKYPPLKELPRLVHLVIPCPGQATRTLLARATFADHLISGRRHLYSDSNALSGHYNASELGLRAMHIVSS